MEKRKYTKTELLLPEIKEKIEEGKRQREIEEYFGLDGDRPIHNLLKRQRRKEKRQETGIPIKPKGRPYKNGQPPRQRKETEIERLRMENKLRRDFLQSTGRK